MKPPLNPKTFLEAVCPALASGDVERLAEAVRCRWEVGELCPLLRHQEPDIRRVAALVLGIVGGRVTLGCLARSLHDPDPAVQELAEDAMWSIWFRGGSYASKDAFERGLHRLQAEDYDDAVDAFAEATAADPEFAEAYNQSAIAHYLAGRWDASRADARRALARMPMHFGALAGLGHCHAHLHAYPEAADCYRRALAINPRLTMLPDAIVDLKASIATEHPSPVKHKMPLTSITSQNRWA